MLLENKTAVIYGAGGAVGGAVARAFGREGAKVFLTGRTLASLEATARDIVSAGGAAEIAEVDALDEQQVDQHIAAIVTKTGRVDVSFNSIAIPQPGIQGVALAELSVERFMAPVTTYLKSHFLTARAAARRMAEAGSGVILMHTPEPARLGLPFNGGMAPAWAAMESLNRSLSAEFGPRGVRSVVIRSSGLPETHTIDVVFGLHAQAIGIPVEQFRAMVEGISHRKRSSTLAEVAETAVFLASDKGSGLTGTVANLTGGAIVD